MNYIRKALTGRYSEDGEILTFDQMALTCHLILAVQELERRLNTLEQKVN
jgi:hypothetical protein